MADIKVLNKTRTLVELGNFEMVSGVARISDPCYDKKTWCAGKIKDVLNGTWKAQVIKKVEEYKYLTDEAWHGGRTFKDRRNVLIAIHESFDKSIHTDIRKVTAFHGGMDAGMAGIFDDKFYKKNYKVDYLQVGNVEYNHDSFQHSRQANITMYEAQLYLCQQDPKKKELVPIYEQMLESAKELINNPPGPDYSKAEKTRDWYDICCDKSLSNIGAGVIRNGVVSSSGYGDGGFTTFAVYNQDGQVVGIKLRF